MPRGQFNELTDETFVTDAKHIAARAVKSDKKDKASLTAGMESPKMLELEAENRKLRGELMDALETVDILKNVLAD